MDWDVFISHAWEDKEDMARPLAEALRRKGLRVWYDEFTLTLGDSLRRSIDRGLAQSRYGVVILSPSFFAKEWPQKELDGLVAREVGSGKVILPVWHNITREDVRHFSPTLADKLAVSTAKGLDAVVEEILRALGAGGATPPPPPLPPKKRKINITIAIAIIGVIGGLIALGTWLVPNAADWLFKTPTVTPTSSPTHTPVIFTATPTNTPSPPTATPTFTPASPTPTQVLPTDTPTLILPTPTHTPTSTPSLPTATHTPTAHLTGKIAYVMSDGLHVMNADGSNRERVYRGKVRKRIVSPDASMITFLGDNSVWTLTPGDAVQHIFTMEGIRNVAWITYPNLLYYEIGLGDGYIVKIPGGIPEPVGDFGWGASISPDGSWVIYGGSYHQPGLISQPLFGGSRITLDVSAVGSAVEAVWSPDGTKIAYQNYGILVVNPDGSGRIRLTDSGSKPNWSPDGTRIVYLKNGDIFVINVGGSGQTKLTEHPAHDWDPCWSPDGSKIAFTTDRDGNKEIYVINADGSNQVNLTNSADDEWQPTWAP